MWINEENRWFYKVNYKGRNLAYKEPEVPEECIARAALVLYKIVHEEKYEKYIFLNITSKKGDDKYTNGFLKLEDLRGINPIEPIPAV